MEIPGVGNLFTLLAEIENGTDERRIEIYKSTFLPDDREPTSHDMLIRLLVITSISQESNQHLQDWHAEQIERLGSTIARLDTPTN